MDNFAKILLAFNSDLTKYVITVIYSRKCADKVTIKKKMSIMIHDSIDLWDDFDAILEAGKVDVIGFRYGNIANGKSYARNTLYEMVTAIESYSREWLSLFEDEPDQVILWNNRMRIVDLSAQAVTCELDSNPNWEQIALNLGFMNAFRSAAHEALNYYQDLSH